MEGTVQNDITKRPSSKGMQIHPQRTLTDKSIQEPHPEPPKWATSKSWFFMRLNEVLSYNSDVHHYNTRNRANLHMVKITSKSGYRSFAYSAAKLFNNLDYATKRSLTLKEFVNNYWSK